jgi:predicted RNase H-like HicB family nuclease
LPVQATGNVPKIAESLCRVLTFTCYVGAERHTRGLDAVDGDLVRAVRGVADTGATAFQRFVSAMRRILHLFENERTEDHSAWKLTIRVKEDPLDGGWIASCPDLPGCFSQGETRDEALYNLSDAVAGIISLRIEQQLSATPGSDSEELEVAVAS